MATLDGPRWGPKSGGAPKQIVFLLHGYGADGHDLIDLAPHWAQAAPDALFLAPHAPEPCEGGPFGRQWFGLTDRSPESRLAGARRAHPLLDAHITEACAAAGLPESAVVLMGFSQGCMMALFTGLRRKVAPAAILGFSGMLIGPEVLAAEMGPGRPDILLVHGEADQVVPVQASRMAEAALKQAGLPVEALYTPGLAHGIGEDGLSLGALVLQRAVARIEGAAA